MHDARRVGVVGAVVEAVDGARGVLEALVPGGRVHGSQVRGQLGQRSTEVT